MSAEFVAVPVSGEKKLLGRWRQLGLAFSGVIGSGWLLAGQAATANAGQTAVLSWVLGAAVLAMMAVVMVRLAIARPQSGGLVRWPIDSSGRTAGMVIAAGLIVVYSANAPSESAAVVSGLGYKVHGLVDGRKLTPAGLAVAFGVMTSLFGLNWFGLKLVASLNAALTVLKFLVPVVAVAALAIVAFSWHTLSSHPGIHEIGYSPGLASITTAGIVYAFTGFQGPLDHADEADVSKLRWAVLIALLVSAVIYVALQVIFLGSAGPGDLKASAPYPSLARGAGLGWLAVMLFIDSMISPFATALVFISFTGAGLQASADKRVLAFSSLARTSGPRGIPRQALMANYAIGLVMLGALKAWTPIVAATSVVVLFVYSYTAISYTVFRRMQKLGSDTFNHRMPVLAPATLGIATTIAYFAGWPVLWKALSLMFGVVAIMLYFTRGNIDPFLRQDRLSALWIFVYFALLLGLAALHNYHAHWEAVPAWTYGVSAFALGVAAFYTGVSQSLKFHATVSGS